MRVCCNQQKQNRASFNNSAILQAGQASDLVLSGQAIKVWCLQQLTFILESSALAVSLPQR